LKSAAGDICDGPIGPDDEIHPVLLKILRGNAVGPQDLYRPKD
jgi:hypothetical protein